MAINTQDVVDTVSDAVTGAQLANTAGNLAGISMPGVFGTLAGPVGYGIKAVTDIYSASPTKPGFFGRLLDRQLMPLRRLGILSTSQADDPFGGYGTEEAEQEGVAGIDTGAGGYAREVTGPVDVTGLTIGGSEFGFDPDSNQRGPDQTQVDANISRSRSLATMDWDESDPDTSTDTDTDTGDFQDPDDIDYGHDEEDWADGGHVQKYANGDFVKKKAPSLTDTTVTELLLFKSDPYNVWLTGESSPDFSSGAVTFEGKEDLPNLSLFGSGAPEGKGYNRTYGGSLRTGPFDIYGTKGKFTEGDYKKGTETYGASGRMPVGKRGIMTLGISKEKVGEILQHFKGKGGKKRYDIGYTGRGDGSTYGATGTMEQVKGGPRTRSVQGFYNMQNPLGLGGNLNVSGSFVNPEAGKNAAEAMLRYGVRF